MRAAVYLRISRDREGLKLGVDRQLKICRDLCKRRGYTVVDVFQDNDKSASTLSKKPRPRYQAMLEACRDRKVDVVVAYSTSRLTRRPREFEDLIDLALDPGVKFDYEKSPAFDLSTAQGRKYARNRAADDAEEAEETQERVLAEVAQRAEQGRFHGGNRLYGVGVKVGEEPVFDRLTGKPKLDDNGDFVMRTVFDHTRLVPEEKKVLREAAGALLSGTSERAVVRRMNAKGILTTRGNPWSARVLRATLLNPRMVGKRDFHGTLFSAPNPPILDPETYEKLKVKLTNPDRLTTTTNRLRWLGTGLFVCDRCDLTVRTDYTGRRSSRRVYRCHKGCQRSWAADPVDEFVVEVIAVWLARSDLRALLARRADGVDITRLQGEIAEYRTRRGKLAELFADGVLDEASVRIQSADLKLKIEENETRIAEASESGALASIISAPDPAEAWRHLAADDTDAERRQEAVRALAEIRLGQPKLGRVAPDLPKLVRIKWVYA